MFNSLCFLRMSELDWVAALTAAFSVLKSSRFLEVSLFAELHCDYLWSLFCAVLFLPFLSRG